MKRRRLWFLLAVFAFLVVVLLTSAKFWKKSPYESFARQPAPYFAEVAHACDLLLDRRREITNRFLKLSGNESSLPAAVLRMHASEVRVYANRVWIGFDAEEDSFAVLWEPQAEDPKQWALMTDFAGRLKPVYVERK